MSDMFIELLISHVKTSRLLWDMNSRQYHNRILVDREWTRIAADLQETKEVVKTKWRSLRDKFKKELRKVPKHRSGDDGEHAPRYTGTWCHFESMMFIKSIVTPKPTQGNINIVDDDSCSTQFLQDSEDFDQNVSSESPSPDSQPTDSPLVEEDQSSEKQLTQEETGFTLPIRKKQNKAIGTSRKRKAEKKMEDSIETEFLRLEAKKVALLEKNDEEDEDINFFKSLLPHVKQLSSINKLRFRSQVQNLLIEEIGRIHNIPQLTPTIPVSPVDNQQTVYSNENCSELYEMQNLNL